MAQIIADQRDIEFNLYEMFDIEQFCAHERFQAFDRKAFILILTEAREFALKEMLAAYRDGDEKGVFFENGRVRVPESFHRVHHRYCENHWAAPASERQFGGQGLPYLITCAIREYMMGANWPIYAYGSMGAGTGSMIELFGTPGQQKVYVANLYSGRWAGTMFQTESQAGTGADTLITTAQKSGDGSFRLSGRELYITNGDHDLCSNIIHPVLARVEGDPPGPEGISVFIVPKYLPGPDGEPGEANDIVCTGIEEKHGLHGSATCTMALGDKGRCLGYLLGQQGQGLEIITAMLTRTRLTVGIQALAYGSAAYLYALDHTRNRIQVRDLENPAERNHPPVPIIRHPDVKRNLIEMKAFTEGLRSLIYFSMEILDRISIETDKKKKADLTDLVELLTPVIKGFGCEQSYNVCIRAIQVFGGAGYIRDYPVESITRDCKVTSIFEGCTGILAQDLLTRKLFMKEGRPFKALIQRIEEVIEKSRTWKRNRQMGGRLSKLLKAFTTLTARFEKTLHNRRRPPAYARATPFLEVMGEICTAWMLLLRANMAAAALDSGNKTGQDELFYTGQIRTALFFFDSVLPVTQGKINALVTPTSAVNQMTEPELGGF